MKVSFYLSASCHFCFEQLAQPKNKGYHGSSGSASWSKLCQPIIMEPFRNLGRKSTKRTETSDQFLAFLDFNFG